MATRDRWSALGLAVLAVAYLLAGRRYPLDTLATPGPGIFPLAAGVGLLILAVCLFVSASWASAPEAVAEDVTSSGTPLVMAAVLVLFAATLPALGFVLASFALVVVAARLMGLQGWWRPLALGAGLALATRLVFVTWLGVPLP
ncbi:MAG TPA: tripartite tricarboxylate transporter TctB family protein [Methylomirabilota bacterium]